MEEEAALDDERGMVREKGPAAAARDDEDGHVNGEEGVGALKHDVDATG